MHAEADVAAVAVLIGDPARAAMLTALQDGRALPAGELSRRARVSPSTASAHLARLVEGGLLTLERSGRHRYFRLAGEDVAHALEALALIAPAGRVQTMRAAVIGEALAEARTCYDHLAGRLGVGLAGGLLRTKALVDRDGTFALGPRARTVLASLGVDVEALPPRRPAVLRCLDWSERRPHVAGALGAAVCARALDAGWVERLPSSRAVRLTPVGREALGTLLS